MVGAVATMTPWDAHAAEVQNAFKNITITAASGSGPINPWEQVRVTADWSVPDQTPAGDTFTMSWPTDKLSGASGKLALKAPDGATVANCTMAKSGVACTLTEYVTAHPYDIGGKVWFQLTQVNAEENTTITVPFTGSTTQAATYTTSGSGPFGSIGFDKDGEVREGGATWFVYFPGGPNGQTVDLTDVVVDDTLGNGQTVVPGSFVLQHATELGAGGHWPNFQDASSSLFTVAVDPNGHGFQFKAPLLAKGGWWRLTYKVTVPAGYQGTLVNTANASWNNSETVTTSHEESYFAAGGTGSGFMKSVSVGDTVWFDENRDGLQNEGAGSGVPGAVLTLTGPDGKPVTDVNGKPVAPITTGPTGTYLFENLPVLDAGKHYTVSVTPPAGYLPTTPGVGTDRGLDSSTGSAESTDLTSGGAKDLTLDFGFVRQINLRLAKSLTSGGPFHPGGTATFTLRPHNDGPGAAQAGWSVTEVLPAGLTLVSMAGNGYTCAELTCTAADGLAAGADGAPITVTATIGGDVTGPLHNVAYVSPAAGEITETNPLVVPTTTTDTSKTPTDNDAQADLSVTPVPLVSVGDYVWWDTNRNGVQDSNERPVPGVTVLLQDTSGATIGTTTTDENGYYSFKDLVPGATYTVVFQKPANTTFTVENAGGDDAVDSDAPASGRVTFAAPPSGSNKTAPGQADLPTIDAGLVQINLVLAKTLTSPVPTTTGATVTYSLVPRNEGPVDALSGWSVTDVPQQGMTVVSMTGEGYTCTGLTCTSANALPAGAAGKPITVTVKLPDDVDGLFRNVAFVAPSADEAPETNPLVVPNNSTDTKASPTDNDAEAVLTVKIVLGENIVVPPSGTPTPGAPTPGAPIPGPRVTLPNTGTSVPLAGVLGGLGALVAGLALVVVGSHRAKGRRSVKG